MGKQQHQLSFHGRGLQVVGNAFGGSDLTSHPKIQRPIESKLPIHLVLRAQKSVLRSPAIFEPIDRIVKTVAKRHGVKIYSFVNVGNHLHLLIRVSRRSRWAGFIRDLTGQIALFVRKKLSLILEGRFWKGRPYTRIVQGWRKAFRTVKSYLYLNQLEADGMISRQEIRTLSELRSLWSG